jgi:hypothetical protein
MIVKCNTVEDFLTDIESQVKRNGSGCIVQNTVRLNVSKREISDVTHAVVLQGAAIVSMKEGGEYLLQFGIECGHDYSDASQEYAGTDLANKQIKRIKDFCTSYGLTVGPGVIKI